MTITHPKKPKGGTTTLHILHAILCAPDGHAPTEASLAKMAQTNPRSIYRHLALLRASGIEIESGGSEAPGYRVVGGWLRRR